MSINDLEYFQSKILFWYGDNYLYIEPKRIEIER